jgi:hypothetical protein
MPPGWSLAAETSFTPDVIASMAFETDRRSVTPLSVKTNWRPRF